MKTAITHAKIQTGRLFFGSASQAKSFLKGKLGYYVYILRRPDVRPFYVGKGKGDRFLHHSNRARHAEISHKLNVIRSIRKLGHELIYEIDSLHEVEHAAHRREVELIKAFKRLHEGGCLTNQTAGGEGGSDPSPESREKHRQTLGGMPMGDGDRAAVNQFVLALASLLQLPPPRSFFIKPETRLKARPTAVFPAAHRSATVRPAMALIGSAIKNDIGLEPGCRIPRRLIVNGVNALIENGVSRDLVTSNMATLIAAADASDELFTLNCRQVKQIIDIVGAEQLTCAGILRRADACATVV